MKEPGPSVLRPSGYPDEIYVFSTGQDVHQASLDDYDPELLEPWSWTGQAGIRRGAYILLYVTHPISAFCWIGRACSDSEKPASALGRSCLFVELHPLGRPLSLADARAHPVVGLWKPLLGGGGLEGSSRRVKQPEVWDAAVTELCERNPGLADLLARWRSEPPLTPAGDLEDFVWEGGPGWDYPFRRERPLQEGVRDFFVEQEPFRAPEPRDGAWLKDFEVRLGRSGRADNIQVAEDESQPTLLLIETKVFAVNPGGIEQLGRYERWIGEHHPKWRIRKILCAQEFSEAVLESAAAEGVECLSVGWPSQNDDYGPDEVDWVIGPVTLDPPIGAEDLAMEARRVAGLLADAPRRSFGERDDAPARPGMIAYWPAGRAAAALGLTDVASEAPLWVEPSRHIAKSLRALAEGETRLADVLIGCLGIAADLIPWWWSAPHSARSLAAWGGANLQFSCVELDEPAGLRRATAAMLEASLSDLDDADEARLRATFTPRGLRGLRAADLTMAWFGWLLEMAPQWRGSPDMGVSIRVDADGYLDEVAEGGTASGRVLHLSPAELNDPLQSLQASEPPGWNDVGPETGPAPDWLGTVEVLKPEEALAVVALMKAQPFIEGAVLRSGRIPSHSRPEQFRD